VDLHHIHAHTIEQSSHITYRTGQVSTGQGKTVRAGLESAVLRPELWVECVTWRRNVTPKYCTSLVPYIIILLAWRGSLPVCLAVGKNTMILKLGLDAIWWSRIIERARICWPAGERNAREKRERRIRIRGR
jgi:hypothetical protein